MSQIKEISLILKILEIQMVLFALLMLMGASSATVSTEGGRQASVAAAQESNLTAYLNSRSAEQIALVEAAQAELIGTVLTLAKQIKDEAAPELIFRWASELARLEEKCGS